MKKALGQTVRDLKRGVNKKVLKVPTIEQKVLDCTSNEPWGPHGALLADIAQATRNYHEYQMIMSILWKRTNDTGKNWRHVYKALTVLEYLVAHGSERVIDDIREHAYQIQTLSDFQYIDSSGRDQGSNVRKKSQGLVVLVNDKERIQEAREKAASNREKFRNAPAGSVSRPGGYGDRYDNDNYGSRDDDRNGSGRGREYGYRDDDRYAYGRDGDRYGREYEDHYGGDGDYRGRSPSVDNYSSRGRSSDRDKYEDDDQYPSRGSGARGDEQSQDGRPIERKLSEQNLDAPPSYEDAVSDGHSPTHRESYGETPQSAPKSSFSPAPASSSPTQATSTTSPALSPNLPAVQAMNENGADGFDEFDPRGSYSAASTTSSGATPTTSVGAELDLLGSLSDSFTGNPLALVPTSVNSTNINDNLTKSGPTFTPTSAPSVPSQGFDDPFGDGPFKAIPSANGAEGQQQQGFNSISFQSGLSQGPELPQQVSQGAAEGSFSGTAPFGELSVHSSSTDAQYQQQEFSTHDSSIDILADILPPTGSQHNVHPETGYAAPVSQAAPQPGFLPQTGQNVSPATFSSQSNPMAHQTDFPAQPGQPSSLSEQHVLPTNFMPQTSENMSQATFSSQSAPNAQQTGFSAQSSQPIAQTGFPGQPGQLVVHPNFPSQYGQPPPQAGFAAHGGQPPSLNGYENQAAQASHTANTLQHAFQMNQSQHGVFQSLPGGQAAPSNPAPYGNYNMQSGYRAHVGPTMSPQASAGATSQVNASNLSVASQPGLPSTSSTAPLPPKDKQFATKSTVWTDTLSRGLVNLDISGVKTNPMSDIGIDFDALNRKEKRMEKPSTTPVTSTVHMGKAMGSGTGMGRAGAGAIRPPPNPMMGTGAGAGMGMGMGMGGPRPGLGVGGYGGMNQQAMGGGMGMNMNMGGQMQQPTGFPPGSNMQGGYNPMMGAGNYGQNPYGGGYRSI